MEVNGYEVIQKITGINKSEQVKILEEIRKNREVLQNCSLHEFSIKISQERVLSKWKCKNCGGIVDNSEKYWYEKGLNHGVKKEGYNM